MHYGWPSTSIPILTSGNYTFQVNEDEGSWLVSMLPIGSVFGNIIATSLANVIGSKRLILFATLPLLLSWILIAVGPTVVYIFIARFLAGISDGISFTSVLPYLSEISDYQIRGMVCCIFPVMQVFGMLFMNLLQFFLPMSPACLVGASVTVLPWLILPWIPESPYFYLMKDDIQAAKYSLQKFTGRLEVCEDLDNIKKGLTDEHRNKGSFIDIFVEKLNRKALIIASLVYVAQQVTGINAVFSYSTTIFENAKEILDPHIANLIFYTLFFLGTIFALIIVDYAGRKVLLCTSVTLTGIALLINGLYLYLTSQGLTTYTNLKYIPLLCIMIFPLLCSIGIFSVPCVLSSEILPSHVKAAGLSIINFIYVILVTMILKFFTFSSTYLGSFVPFFVFAGCCVISLLFIVFKVPETKKRTLEYIQMKIRSEKL